MRRQGFVFFEVLCVVAIFGVLISIVVVGERRRESQRANRSMCGGNNLKQIGLAALQYLNGSYFPRQGR
jgi:prepilin-type N-terminal cleavage/methylation domain-containing protein